MDIDQMHFLLIFIVLPVAAILLGITSQTMAWNRYGHHQHDLYIDSHHRLHPSHHTFPGYRLAYRPQYTKTHTEQDGWNLTKKTNDKSDSALNLFYMGENDEWRFR